MMQDDDDDARFGDGIWMIEVEVKARCNPEIREKIVALGAIQKGTEHHHDIYFNSPMRDFRITDEALRIRRKDEGARLTYKGPKLDSQTKSRLELTVMLDDPSAMEKILAELGFRPSGEVRKKRTKYALGEIIFALDDVAGLGTFLEIEAPAEDDWIAKQAHVMEIFHQLGLEESIRKSYLELLMDQQKYIPKPRNHLSRRKA
jgi:adenylate cyclase class 2